MGYWEKVVRLAYKEALQEVRWDSPVRVAQSFGVPLISGAFVWAATKQVAWSAVATLGVAAVVAVTVFFVKALAIPPRLAREAAAQRRASEEALRAQLDLSESRKPRYELKPDTDLAAAIVFSATGEWGASVLDVVFPSKEIARCLQEFRQLAFNGRIRVWATKDPLGLQELLPKGAWEANYVDAFDLNKPGARTRFVTHRSKTDAHFSNLMVCKAEWIERGPRPPEATAEEPTG